MGFGSYTVTEILEIHYGPLTQSVAAVIIPSQRLIQFRLEIFRLFG